MPDEQKTVEKPVERQKGGEHEYSYIGPWKMRIRLLRHNQPLWLPKGSVRAIITLSVILTAMYCFVQGVALDETFKTLIATVIAFYFGSRLNFSSPEKKPDGQ